MSVCLCSSYVTVYVTVSKVIFDLENKSTKLLYWVPSRWTTGSLWACVTGMEKLCWNRMQLCLLLRHEGPHTRLYIHTHTEAHTHTKLYDLHSLCFSHFRENLTISLWRYRLKIKLLTFFNSHFPSQLNIHLNALEKCLAKWVLRVGTFSMGWQRNKHLGLAGII